MEETTQIERTRGATPGDGDRGARRPTYVPRTDIYETKDSVIVIADMPGVDRDSVEITLDKGVLTLSGRAAEPPLRAGYAAGHREYEPGDYKRAFTLSEDIDRERIEAAVKDGVLRLVLPKAKAQSRKIPVKAE